MEMVRWLNASHVRGAFPGILLSQTSQGDAFRLDRTIHWATGPLFHQEEMPDAQPLFNPVGHITQRLA